MAKKSPNHENESEKILKSKKNTSRSKSQKSSAEISENLINPEKEYIKRCDDEIRKINEN